ncbi:ATP-binding protein [Actinomadura luteofluorescens]|uniref:ATP-binding protein n=1 Tax=Actinomadura luteofluorescens TaxID=46163 RepID=UPI002164584A|nr:ATP-binding protein [Actinomadura glauciflava]MCR3743624.1 Histidine kinase-, DNA gyrase B-, and HSP90-like ATPase [Actinomadura glauciflava]
MSSLKAKANPTKAFFVRMLTRDISLDDCILDLVDNSIDGAWRDSGQRPSVLRSGSDLSGFKIEIDISEDGFYISDNCGGITLDNAVEYAFTFGRRDEQERVNFTVGVYGIGMKRAVFKLGRKIRVKSTYRSNGELSSFVVPIDVGEWLERGDEAWDFAIDDSEARAEPGVSIEVEDLLDETREKFSDPTYERSLRRMLARDYMVSLRHGLEITVNGVRVEGWKLEFRENENFAPMRDSYEDGDVTVEITAGMTSPPPDDLEPDEEPHSDVSGWYILCNGRVVLAADTTTLTAWGTTLPKWHKQYNGFAGIVQFSSENPELLPMTTTKRSVDTSSRLYQRALVKMHKPARAWIDYTNARKQDVETVKELEKAVVAKDIFEVAPRPTFKTPEVTRPKSRERTANVNYTVPLRRMRALATGFGNDRMSYREVGLEAFEYAYENLVDEGA